MTDDLCISKKTPWYLVKMIFIPFQCSLIEGSDRPYEVIPVYLFHLLIINLHQLSVVSRFCMLNNGNNNQEEKF
jgi:hypothetical protein